MRLHKYIANCGYTSRRRAELLIAAGRVRVNGQVVTEAGAAVEPDRDRVTVNGDRVVPPERLTIILNKLPGFITSTHDTHDRLTVMDLLPRRMREIGVLPVGRLDQDTSGLLILSNDGDLNHRITHPSFEIEKEYLVEVQGGPSAEAFRRAEEGIEIEGVRTGPARVSHVEPLGGTTRFRIVISEGRKRQIKRMFEAVGHPVKDLARVRIGGLMLGKLPPGEWRKLHPTEVEAIIGSRQPREEIHNGGTEYDGRNSPERHGGRTEEDERTDDGEMKE
jgi:23S rRNA pseudouridine2605 synthase